MLRLIDMLNPDNEPGRLTLIVPAWRRQGRGMLPAMIRAVKREGKSVVWSCDPMHGNTITATTGYKTRPFDLILKEVKSFFSIHAAEGTHAGGVHLEMTGQNVTECTGGAHAITDEGPQRPLSHAVRSAAQCRAGDRTRFPDGRPAQAGARRRPSRCRPCPGFSTTLADFDER